MTEQEKADNLADEYSRQHRAFRELHWKYFYSISRVCHITGAIIPRESRPEIDRESLRLFTLVQNANKAALDLEYIQRKNTKD